MSNLNNYQKYVVGSGHYRHGLIRRAHSRQTRSAWPFKGSDYPDKWNMKRVTSFQRSSDIFWTVGYINYGQFSQKKLINVGYNPSFYCSSDNKKYWWCRDGNWIPEWGEATEQRCNLMKELRTFYVKRAILEVTSLPEDIVGLFLEYLGGHSPPEGT